MAHGTSLGPIWLLIKGLGRLLYVAGWVAGAALRALLSLTGSGMRWTRALGSLGPDLICDRGCRSPADGFWTCESCGGLIRGWVWSPCRICGSRPGGAICGRCGSAIANRTL